MPYDDLEFDAPMSTGAKRITAAVVILLLLIIVTVFFTPSS
jgi:hypothetical protein